MKRKLLDILFCIMLCSIGLVGCGSNPTKTDEADKAFYDELYDEQVDKGSTYEEEDCEEQILLEEKNNSLLEECDITATSENEESMVEQVVIPAYKKYVSENYGNGDYDAYNFIYIDEDDIPELLFDNSADGRATQVLSYQNGEICVSSAWCRGYGFDYVPKENKVIYYGVYFGDESGSVAHLENGVLVEEHSYSFDFNDATGEGGTYQIDGVECSEAEYNNFIETYFKYENTRDGWEIYSSIDEAYENIGKSTFSTDGGYITKFEMTDNVLIVETEYGQSISYPVADSCTWEETSYGEVYGTYTYETLKSEMESERSRYLADPEWYESPVELFIEIKDDIIIKIYTMKP